MLLKLEITFIQWIWCLILNHSLGHFDIHDRSIVCAQKQRSAQNTLLFKWIFVVTATPSKTLLLTNWIQLYSQFERSLFRTIHLQFKYQKYVNLTLSMIQENLHTSLHSTAALFDWNKSNFLRGCKRSRGSSINHLLFFLFFVLSLTFHFFW